MRYKVVPDPDVGADSESEPGARGVDALAAVRAAVPLVPGSVEDCCTRIRDATDLASRDAAREWLTFVEALELVEETARGYRRRRVDPDPGTLAESFEARVFGAAELLDALERADGPLDADGAFDRLRGEVPRWERDRHADWEREWRERTERLLEWAVAFGLVERSDGMYSLSRRVR